MNFLKINRAMAVLQKPFERIHCAFPNLDVSLDEKSKRQAVKLVSRRTACGGESSRFR